MGYSPAKRTKRPAGPLRIGAAAVAIVLGAGGTAAAAQAEPGAGYDPVDVTPGMVRPGGSLALVLRACHRAGGQARSRAFQKSGTFRPVSGGLLADARVRWDAAPGDYRVSARCADPPRQAEGVLTVLGGDHRADQEPVGSAGSQPDSVARRPSGSAVAIGAALAVVGVASWCLAALRRRRGHWH